MRASQNLSLLSMCDKPGVFHLSQFHSTNTGTLISYTSAISQYWQSSWHLLEEATYLKTCQLLSWNVEQNGRKWREFSGSTGWVGHSRSCPKAMFISLVDGIPVLKHCIHASIFPAVWGSTNGFASEFDHAQCSHQRRWRRTDALESDILP